MLLLACASLLNLILVHSQTSYPIYNVSCSSDSHYDCGYAIGVQARTRIQRYIATYPHMAELRICLIIGCSVQLRDLVFYNRDIWPQYYEEIQGIAEGANVEEMDIHLLTFKHEVLALRGIAEKVSQDEGSDILLNENGILRFEGFGHNEDGWSGLTETGFFSHYSINGENEFFSFDYPGSLIGHSFGFNQFGLAVSTNILYPSNVSTEARGVYWLTRAMLDAQSLSEAVDVINDNAATCSFGVSINLGYLDRNNNGRITIANVEVANNAVSIQYYGEDGEHPNEEAYGFHFDEYLRLDVKQETDIPSGFRLSRTEDLIAQNGIPKHAADIVNILGDTEDAQYPIYRDGAAPDTATTLSTAIFDIARQSMSVYQVCNPKTCDAAFTLSFDFDEL